MEKQLKTITKGDIKLGKIARVNLIAPKHSLILKV